MNNESVKYLESLGMRIVFNETEALADKDVPKEVVAAIKERNVDELERLLGARTNLVCGIFPAEDDEEDDSEEEPQESAQLKQAI